MSTHKLRLAGYAPEASTHSQAFRYFRNRLQELVPTAEVEIVWNILDEGIRVGSIVELVQAGEVTICYLSTSYLTNRVPELALIDTPYRFPSLKSAHRSLDGDIGRELSDRTREATGLEVLGYWDNGFRHLTNRLRDVQVPADCVAMRVRVQPNPIHERMIELWGGVPVPTDLSTGIALIASGAVDAQENPLSNTLAYGVDGHHGHVTMTGHVYGARGIYANCSAFQSWSMEMRQAVLDAAGKAVAWQRQESARGEVEAVQRLQTKSIKVIELSEAQRDAFSQAVRPLREEIDDGLPRKLLEVPE